MQLQDTAVGENREVRVEAQKALERIPRLEAARHLVQHKGVDRPRIARCPCAAGSCPPWAVRSMMREPLAPPSTSANRAEGAADPLRCGRMSLSPPLRFRQPIVIACRAGRQAPRPSRRSSAVLGIRASDTGHGQVLALLEAADHAARSGRHHAVDRQARGHDAIEAVLGPAHVFRPGVPSPQRDTGSAGGG